MFNDTDEITVLNRGRFSDGERKHQTYYWNGLVNGLSVDPITQDVCF